jgi:hypothetical protein
MMLLLVISMAAELKAGNASRYGYAGDAFDNGAFACKGTLLARYGQRRWQTMRDHGVANRTLACGTPLAICNPRTNQCTAAYVVDRGPYGAVNRKGEWHARTKLKPGEHYRGALDLLPGVYTAIALTGIEPVLYSPIGPPEPAAAPAPAPVHRNHAPWPRLRASGHSLMAYNFAPDSSDTLP